MITKKFVKVNMIDKQGKVHLKYVDETQLVSGHELKPFSDEVRRGIQQKIETIERILPFINKAIETGINPDTGHEINEWSKYCIELFRDELLIDLNEDRELIKYNGMIPKHINVRGQKKAERMYERWEKRLGRETFLDLKDDVDKYYRESISVDIDPTTGGGKF